MSYVDAHAYNTLLAKCFEIGTCVACWYAQRSCHLPEIANAFKSINIWSYVDLGASNNACQLNFTPDLTFPKLGFYVKTLFCAWNASHI